MNHTGYYIILCRQCVQANLVRASELKCAVRAMGTLDYSGLQVQFICALFSEASFDREHLIASELSLRSALFLTARYR